MIQAGLSKAGRQVRARHRARHLESHDGEPRGLFPPVAKHSIPLTNWGGVLRRVTLIRICEEKRRPIRRSDPRRNKPRFGAPRYLLLKRLETEAA